MANKAGDRLPDGTLTEMIDTERPGCTVGPNNFSVGEITKGKKIVIFGLPGAFTPTCSAKHVPSYVQSFDRLRAKGVDEVWCIAVNDAFVMGAWGRDQKAGGNHRVGLEQDEQGDGQGRDQQVVGYCRPRDEPKVSANLDQLGEGHPQPDQHHHLDQRDRDQEIDQPVERHRHPVGALTSRPFAAVAEQTPSLCAALRR
jgi:peroxiredoxin